MTTYTPSATVADYTPLVDGAGQTLEVYRHASGSPVFLWFGTEHDSPDGELNQDDGLPYMAFEAGLTVVLAGYSNLGFAPLDDHHYPERDAAYAVQHLRENAATLDLDAEFVVIAGDRRGANAAAWAALGDDLADPGGNAQEQQSSRTVGLVGVDMVVYWQAMIQARTRATDFEEGAGATLSAVAEVTQDAASPGIYGDDVRNAELPVYLIQRKNDEGQSTDLPWITDTLDELGSSWHGKAMREILLAFDEPGLAFETHLLETIVDDLSDGPEGSSKRAAEANSSALDWSLTRTGRMPAEEQVVRRVEAVLSQITFANGFGTDVQRVGRFLTEDEVRAYPAILIKTMGTAYDHEAFATKVQNRVRIGLALILRGWQRHDTRTAIFIADVRKAVTENPQFGAVADKSWPEDVRRFTDEDSQGPRSGATLVLRVWFRDVVRDPYTIAP